MEAAFYPLDTVKTRLQARRHGERVRVFRGLYRGLGGNLVGVAPATALFFAAYEPMKAALASGRDGGDGGGGVVSHLTAGAVAGLVSSVVRVPTEVIKTRRQVGASAGASVRSIVAANGVAGLFVGYGSFLLRDLPFDAIEFAGYESMKTAWVKLNSNSDVNGAEAAGMGAVAGAFAGAATTPLDVVKTRLMTTSPGTYRGVMHCVQKTVSEEGGTRHVQGHPTARSVDRSGRRMFLLRAGDGERRPPAVTDDASVTTTSSRVLRSVGRKPDGTLARVRMHSSRVRRRSLA